MRPCFQTCLLTLLAAGALSGAGQEASLSQRAALDLSAQGEHAGAAIEFRRAALAEPAAEAQAAFYWAAACEYLRIGRVEMAAEMLERAETVLPNMDHNLRLLRAETEMARQNYAEAGFHYQGLLEAHAADDAFRTWLARRLAIAELYQGATHRAREALARAPTPQTEALVACERYMSGRDRSPLVGGLCGLIPGLGYAYSGEYANGLRSLLLNGLFLFGLIKCAEEDLWGAAAVIGFFEITWYSGSIYGGVDAAHRFNRRRLEDCAEGIQGTARLEPDFSRLPAIGWRINF